MQERKQSFLERLTGTRVLSPDELEREIHGNRGGAEEDGGDDIPREDYADTEESGGVTEVSPDESDEELEENEPGVAVDMYETDNELIIQCMIAGVTPENLHISITRDMVTLKGRRIELDIPEDDYLMRELYWGSFSREITLPYEIDTDGAEAVEKYGLLIIRLPKLDTRKTAELKVKSI